MRWTWPDSTTTPPGITVPGGSIFVTKRISSPFQDPSLAPRPSCASAALAKISTAHPVLMQLIASNHPYVHIIDGPEVRQTDRGSNGPCLRALLEQSDSHNQQCRRDRQPHRNWNL